MSVHGIEQPNYADNFSNEGGVKPGERCPTCDRRQPKPRQSDSPPIKRVVAAGPPERTEHLTNGLDALQAYIGADDESYPRLSLLEALVLLGGQNREELREWYAGRRPL